MKVLLAQTRRWSGSMLTVTTWFVVSFCVAASVLSQPPVTAISYTPDGMQLVVGSEGSLKIIDVVSAEPVGLLGTKLEFVHDARFSRDGKFLAVAGGSPGESGGIEIFLWPEKTLRMRSQISDDVAYAVSWSDDSQQIAVACHDTRCLLINLDPDKTLRTWTEHSRPVRTIQFLDDKNTLVSGASDMTIRVWNAAQDQAVRSLDNHTGEIQAISVSPVGHDSRTRMLVSAGQDKTIRFWQPGIGRLVRFARINSVPLSVEWDQQGRLVVAGCEDGKVVVIDSQTVEVKNQQQILDGPIYCIARQPGSDQFVVGGFQGKWQILDHLIQ